MSKEVKTYNNPNGIFTEEELLEIKKSGKVDEFLSKFRITDQKCPPPNLKPVGGLCFYCEQCIQYSIKKVKIRKGK